MNEGDEDLNKLETKLAKLENKKSKIIQEIKENKKLLKNLTIQPETEELNIDYLKKELDKKEIEFENYEIEYSEYNNILNSKQHEFESILNKEDDLKSKRELLIHEIETNNIKLKSSKSDEKIKNLEKSLDSSKLELKILKTELSNFQSLKQHLKDQIIDNESKIDDISQKKSLINQEINILKKELLNLLEQEERIKSDLIKNDELKSKLRELNYKLDQYNNDIKKLSDKIKILKDEVSIEDENYILSSYNQTLKLNQLSSLVNGSIKFSTLSQDKEYIAELEERIRILEGIKEDIGYKDLIWPLATTYRISTSASYEVTAKAMNIFNLFEMISAFNSIVLLSALPSRIYSDEWSYIWNDYKKYKRLYFGLWVGLYSRLSNIVRKLTDDDFNSMPLNKEFYRSITNKKISRVLDPIPKMRNDKLGHSGNIDESDAEFVIDTLEPDINKIYHELMAYSNLELIYPIHMKKTKDGIYHIFGQKLEKSNYPFDKFEIPTKNDMVTDVLYLYEPDTDDRLMLNSNFISLNKCQKCGNTSLYIYSKIEKGKAIYKSYQTEKHDYELQDLSLDELLNYENFLI